MKKYYKLLITGNDGKVYENPLTLTEMPKLIGQIVKENKCVKICVDVMSKEKYNLTFGIPSAPSSSFSLTKKQTI